MSMTEAEDTNTAEQTPDQPCAVCGAAHDEETGTIVGRIDEESDIPLALFEADTDTDDDGDGDGDGDPLEENPYEQSYCNDCIEDYLMRIQNAVKILRPRQAQAASYMLLGLDPEEAHKAVNAREGEDTLAYSSVREYRKQARRSVREALQLGFGSAPILFESKRN